MKKIILAVLMVLIVATPCFAQEVETDGLFSIKGTKWEALPFQFTPFWYMVLGFSGGTVYSVYSEYTLPTSNSFYIDMLVASIFMYARDRDPIWLGPGIEIGFGILQPIGFGVMITYIKHENLPFPIIDMVLLTKTDNNWKPPEEK